VVFFYVFWLPSPRIRSMMRALSSWTIPMISFLSKKGLLRNSSKLVTQRFLVKARQKRLKE